MTDALLLDSRTPDGRSSAFGLAPGSRLLSQLNKTLKMGMDLQPLRPSKAAPRHPADDKYSPNNPVWGQYNWSGWSWLCEHLEEWGVDTSEFNGCNDGDKISAKTCRAVASAIEAHLHELDDTHRNWLATHVARWRTCGGYAQF